MAKGIEPDESSTETEKNTLLTAYLAGLAESSAHIFEESLSSATNLPTHLEEGRTGRSLSN